MNERIHTDVRFSTLDLEPALQEGVRDAGFELCTPIQAGALPIALDGRDVEGQAQTGTGKTAAFLLATMNHLLRQAPRENHRDGNPRALIVAPTRELAVQIHRDAEVLGRHAGFRLTVVFGGTGYVEQRCELGEGVDILVGTPGRLIDYYKQRVYDLRGVQVAVIDEADRMFDLGFIRDVRYLLRRMPRAEERLNLLFSATLSHRVSELAYEHMNAPTVVNANPERVTVSRVSQKLYHVSKEEKILLALRVARGPGGHPHPRVHQHQAQRRARGELSPGQRHPGRHADRRRAAETPPRPSSRTSSGERCRYWWLPTSPRAGCTSPMSATCSTSICPRTRKTTSTAWDAPPGFGAEGDAVSFACEEFVYSLAAIEEFIGEKIPTFAVSDDLLAHPASPRRARSRRPLRPAPAARARAPARRADDATEEQTRCRRSIPGGEPGAGAPMVAGHRGAVRRRPAASRTGRGGGRSWCCPRFSPSARAARRALSLCRRRVRSRRPAGFPLRWRQPDSLPATPS